MMTPEQIALNGLLAALAAVRGFGYTDATPQPSRRGQSLPHAAAGFGDLSQPYDESRRSSVDSAASLSAPPVLVARWEAREGLPVPAGAVRFANPSSHRPFGDGAVVFANHSSWRPSMAHRTHTTASGHIAVINGQPTTTTQDIAEVYGKQHAKVLAIVRQRMTEVPEEWRLANFGETVTERANPSGGAPIQSPVIRMTKKGFHFVVGKFTGAKAVAHQIAFADEFERMEAELLAQTTRPHNPAIDYDRISPAQAQDLKEIVNAIVKAGVQGHGETWARLHNKFRVNSYLELPATRHLEARQYLLAKLPKGDGGGGVVLDEPDLAERIKRANQTAIDVGARVQAQMFNAVLNGGDDWRHQRWVVEFITDTRHASGPPTISTVPADFYIGSIKDLAGRIRQGEGDKRDVLDLAEAVTMRLFSDAANNPHQGYGAEVAKKIHDGMNWADLHAISVAANMETWLRTAKHKELAAS